MFKIEDIYIFPILIPIICIRMMIYFVFVSIPAIFISMGVYVASTVDSVLLTYIAIFKSNSNLFFKCLLCVIVYIPVIVSTTIISMVLMLSIVVYPIIFSIYDTYGYMHKKQKFLEPKILSSFVDVYNYYKKEIDKYHKRLKSYHRVNNINNVMPFQANLALNQNPLSNCIVSNRIIPINNHRRYNLHEIWQYLGRRCVDYGVIAKNINLISQQDIDYYEPSIIIGLPSIVLFEIVNNSLDIDGIALSNDIILTSHSLPISNEYTTDIYTIYNNLMTAKHKIKQAKINYSSDEYIYILQRLLCSKEENLKNVNIKPLRQIELKNSVCDIPNASVILTRIGLFNSIFAESIERMSRPLLNSPNNV